MDADGRTARAAFRVFDALFHPFMRGCIHAVRIAGLPTTLGADQPLLLVANHVSWWDGFGLRAVQRALRPDAPLFTLMDADQLRAHPYFRLMGAVPIDRRDPRSVARAFATLRRRTRGTPGAVLQYFPQGRIWPAYRRPLGFQRGASVLVRRLAPVTVLPVALHVEPLNHVRPTLFASVGVPILAAEGAATRRLEEAVEAELDRLQRFLARYGEDAPRYWPQPTEPLPVPRTSRELLDAADRRPAVSARWPAGNGHAEGA